MGDTDAPLLARIAHNSALRIGVYLLMLGAAPLLYALYLSKDRSNLAGSGIWAGLTLPLALLCLVIGAVQVFSGPKS